MQGLIYSHATVYGLTLLLLLALYLVNESFYLIAGRQYRRTHLITGLIGTPVHELSHAIGCFVFGMRVTGIAFYRPDPASGTLGYVNFVYNPSRVTHKIGLLCVGISPVIAGVCVIAFAESALGMPRIADTSFAFFESQRTLDTILNYYCDIKYYTMSSPTNAAVTLCVTSVVLHSTPSIADLRNVFRGLSVFVIAGVLLSVILTVADDIIMGLEFDVLGLLAWLMSRGIEMLLIALGVVGIAGCIRVCLFLVKGIHSRIARQTRSEKRLCL